MLGTYVLSSGYKDAYYLKALKVRRLVKKDFDDAFATCDVVMGPTTPTAAFKAGEKSDDPLAMYLSDVYTVSCNLAGIPGLSMPCGFTTTGLADRAATARPAVRRRRSCCASRGCTRPQPTGTRSARRCRIGI